MSQPEFADRRVDAVTINYQTERKDDANEHETD